MINIFCGIVGTATGQSWWLGYADDLLFAAMDVAGISMTTNYITKILL